MSDGKETKPEEGAASAGEESAAELVALALAGRHDRIEDAILAMVPPEVRAALRETREVLSVLGRAEEPMAPSASLRGRLLASVGEATRKARSSRQALVVVDMINDHLKPGALLEVPRAREVVPALKKRIEGARAAGVPVVYVIDEHEPDDPDLDAWGAHAIKGTAGSEVWAELAPQAGDRIVKKPSYSGFYGTNLTNVLDELGVDTLMLTGCLTEIGLMATATDAMQQGFAVEVPADSQAGTSVELEMATMGVLKLMVPYGPSRKRRLERTVSA